ncbi:MAG: ATP-binding protein [Thermodesulfobacteriota bacterium]
MIFAKFIKQVQASYSAKLILIFIASICLMGTILNFTFIRMQQDSYATYTRNSGLSMSRLLAKSVQIDVFTENKEQLAIPMDALLSQENILKVEIFTDKGELLVSRASSESCEIPDLKKTLGDLPQSKSSFNEWPNCFSFIWPVLTLPQYKSEDSLYFDEASELTPVDNHPLGYVSIIMSKRQYQQDIQQIFLKTGLTILFILVLLVTGILLLFRKMTLPLKNLIGKIQRERNIGEVHDDIGLLDTTVTSLVDELDRSFQTINDLTTGLEDKVTERTKQLAMANTELTNRQEYLEESNLKLEKAMKELKETEGQLIQSEKMAALGQVVAGVAHEINNNINFISGALPSLTRALSDIQKLTKKFDEAFVQASGDDAEKKQQEAIALKKELEEDNLFNSLDQLMANIREGVNRTTSIVSELRTFSRSDEQGFKKVDLHDSINSTITFLNKKYLTDVDIHKDYGTIPPVSCRPGRINQVFLNIMNNAIQAMGKKGGILTISTFLNGDDVHIRFTDTGAGINQDTLPKIFDPFFTNKDTGEGSGIGLAVSYKIIQEHQGRIDVQSKEDKGSTFEIVLPMEHVDETISESKNS